jgi:TRAP-type C4-dicarboxylate transport system permease small subunit
MAETELGAKMRKIDSGVQRVIRVITGVLICLVVLFTVYTVIMRYVFDDAPFWGDTVALFANIWLVMLALALAVRTRGQIAMTAFYELCPPRFSYFLEILWNTFVAGFGVFLIFYGYDNAYEQRMNFFWELNDFSKFWPTLIIPITGALLFLAAVAVIVEDILYLRRGEELQSYFQKHLKHG